MLAVLAFCLPGSAQETTPEREGTLEYRDPRLGTLPPRRWDLTLLRSGDPRGGPLTDPKFNAPYPFRLQVRVASGGRPTRRFVVHFRDAGQEALARRVGGVMGRLYWIGLDYLGRAPGGDRFLDVWLRPEGEAGAEEYNGNIYLHAVGERRAPAEWVRELAHEYSHYLLPKIGRYTEPEEWASGYLGERLLMKWLLFDNRQSRVWDAPIDGAAYMTHQVVPLRQAFLNYGPSALGANRQPLADATNERGMLHFIGQVLALEAAHGLEYLKELFNRFATPRPQNLGGYVATMFREMRSPHVAIDPLAYIPARSELVAAEGLGTTPARFKKVAYWILLPGGDWQVEAEGDVPPDATARLDAMPLRKVEPLTPPLTLWDARLSAPNAVWRRLEITAPEGSVVELRRLFVGRKG